MFFAVVFIAFLSLFSREQPATDEGADMEAPAPAEDEPALFVG